MVRNSSFTYGGIETLICGVLSVDSWSSESCRKYQNPTWLLLGLLAAMTATVPVQEGCLRLNERQIFYLRLSG